MSSNGSEMSMSGLEGMSPQELAALAQEYELMGRADLEVLDDRTTRLVPVPVWRKAVMIRALTAKQGDDIARSIIGANGQPDPKKVAGITSRVVLLGTVDAKGEPLFADEAEVGDRNGAAVRFLADQIMRLSGLGTGTKQPEAIEAEKKG